MEGQLTAHDRGLSSGVPGAGRDSVEPSTGPRPDRLLALVVTEPHMAHCLQFLALFDPTVNDEFDPHSYDWLTGPSGSSGPAESLARAHFSDLWLQSTFVAEQLPNQTWRTVC